MRAKHYRVYLSLFLSARPSSSSNSSDSHLHLNWTMLAEEGLAAAKIECPVFIFSRP